MFTKSLKPALLTLLATDPLAVAWSTPSPEAIPFMTLGGVWDVHGAPEMGSGVPGSDKGPSGTNQQAIVGSWRTVVTVEQPLMLDFNSLDTFCSDGTLVAANSPDGSSTTAHGVWVRLPGYEQHEFADTSWSTVLDPSAFPPGTAHVKVRGELSSVSENQMAGPFVVDFLDQDFNVLFSASGTRHYTRIEPERMQ